ncbi:ABC transporter ATP-binding protein [Actinokineospora xionganensis]|uniref:ABC transporter ATP-binding protein n=1 Tax=Actinokineospora xionganensis TaxID=2684470 RepID=A0ABR7KZI8_9PSEU|nr:ABC transporter ATP-binding protein [Actinokineospora xionganensis]MBC6445846.1 ABC transporter ATP-binding protein [Actinokineospora xionganensis]
MDGALTLTDTRSDRGADTPAAVLDCAGLTRSFGDRLAIDDVSLRIAPGETYGLLGPNGAGKSTTIRMVCGLLTADAGTVTVAGLPMTPGAPARALVGYVPQDVALYPDLTARENLRFFGHMYRLRGKQLAERVAEVLDLTGLTDRGGDRVESFSGGMRRRLNIGAALLHRPTLLVLDEPTVGVDPQSRHAILDSVRAFGAAGMAVLYTTHYMEEAERICDRVGIIDHGKLIAEGTPRELVAQVAERDRVELTATGNLPGFATACAALTGVTHTDSGDGMVTLLVEDGRAVLPAVLDAAERADIAVRSVQVVEPDLESVFLHLTGTSLRE